MGIKYYRADTSCRKGHFPVRCVKGGKCFECRREDARNHAEIRRRRLGKSILKRKGSLVPGTRYKGLTATGNFKRQGVKRKQARRTVLLYEVSCDCGNKYWMRVDNWGISECCARCALKNISISNIKHGLSYSLEMDMWTSAKRRAQKKGLAFTIEISDIVIPAFCPVFGVPIDKSVRNGTKKTPRNNAPSLDRFDSSKGYTKNNIAVVSYRANVLKKDGSADEHLKVALFMENHGISDG